MARPRRDARAARRGARGLAAAGRATTHQLQCGPGRIDRAHLDVDQAERQRASARQQRADARKPYVTRQSAIEAELAALTAEKEALDAWLATPDAYLEDAKARLVESMERAGALTWSLARLEAEWLDLAETLERLDAAREA